MIVRGGGATKRGAAGTAATGGGAVGAATASMLTGGCVTTTSGTLAAGATGALTGTVNVGRVPGACGVMNRGAAGVATGAGTTGDAVTGVGAFAAGFASAAGGTAVAGGAAAGRGGTAAGAPCFWIRALRTSPGREMLERSILVLIPSLSERAADFEDAPLPSPCFLKWARTFAASSASRELECVFFSVIPADTSESRIALLFTSSSLARSLIRILLIRLYIPPVSARYSSQPHGLPKFQLEKTYNYALVPGSSFSTPS